MKENETIKDALARVEAALVELEQQFAEISQRRANLMEARISLSRALTGKQPQSGVRTKIVVDGKVRAIWAKTADLAFEILSKQGPMSLPALREEMVAAGWPPSETERKDLNRLYQSLVNLKSKFEGTLGGTWKAIRKAS